MKAPEPRNPDDAREDHAPRVRRTAPRDTDDTTGEERAGERLQKVLAARGVASRRAAEELIQDGRVSVDGRVILELGTKIDPDEAVIKVDGRVLGRPRPTTLILNKPRGYITTASDPEGRRTIYDLLDQRQVRERVYPVGRLDMDSEGLLLLTNDGELANRIAHPRHRIDKEYHALVEGAPPPDALYRLRRGGFYVAGGRVSPAEVAVIGREDGGTWLRVIIHEGRKHQVRRMMEEVGHPVRRLRRVRLGPLTLAGLAPAAYRPLMPAELLRLRRLVGLSGNMVETAPEPEPAETAPPRVKPSRTGERRAPTRTLGEGRPRTPLGRPSGGTRPPGGRGGKGGQGGSDRDGGRNGRRGDGHGHGRGTRAGGGGDRRPGGHGGERGRP